jgi:hypothetical protein
MAEYILPDTSKLIAFAREVLYGDANDWQLLVASELGVRPDTIRQWSSGRRVVPRHTVQHLQGLLDENQIRAAIFREQLAETLPRLKCPTCDAEISVLYNADGGRTIQCANAHFFEENPSRPGHFLPSGRANMPALSPEDQVLQDLDNRAEQARQDWLKASRRNAGLFATAYRDQKGAPLDQLQDARRLEQIYRDLHAQRLDAYRQRFASGREIISSGRGLDEGVPLDVMGPADLSPGAELSLRFTGGQPRTGRVITIEDSGARAVIEVEGKRWWLHRRSTVNVGGVARHPWAVGGREI